MANNASDRLVQSEFLHETVEFLLSRIQVGGGDTTRGEEMAIHFSVIMPIYNAEQYLRQTLKYISSLNQTAFNIFLINDGSTDKSAEIIYDYCKAHSNACMIDLPHGGVSAARNAGLKRADGDYVLFLDADDKFLPAIFSTLQEAIEENYADIIVFGAKVVNHNPIFTLRDIEPRNIVYHGFKSQILFDEIGARPYVWNCAYKRSFIENSALIFSEEVSLGEDQLFQFAAFPAAGVVQFISEKLYQYNYLRRGSAISLYIKDIVARAEAHIKLADKVIETLKQRNVYEELENLTLLWLYCLLKDDILSLKREQFKGVSRLLVNVLNKHNIKIRSMPINLKRKLSYCSIINYSLCIARRIFRHEEKHNGKYN